MGRDPRPGGEGVPILKLHKERKALTPASFDCEGDSDNRLLFIIHCF